MKTYHTHFDQFISFDTKKNNLHNIPKQTKKLENTIFYGCEGIGKYSYVLQQIKNHSPSQLKYEKKINIISNKNNFCFKISDVHFEIDMTLLGCNAKLLWHDIFNHIIDIINVNPTKQYIILLKYFHKIHNELLDIFYSYMKQHSFHKYFITYFIITEHISFIPDNIIKICNIHPISTSNKVSKIFHTNESHYHLMDQQYSLNSLTYISTIYNNIIQEMEKKHNILFNKMREYIYDLLIYDLNISKFIWYLLEHYMKKQLITKENHKQIMEDIYSFYLYYNNNYRPIYHIELLLYKIMCHIYKISI
jgi:hypothetical protein